MDLMVSSHPYKCAIRSRVLNQHMKCHSWAIKVSNNNHRTHRLLNITRQDNTDHLKHFLDLEIEALITTVVPINEYQSLKEWIFNTQDNL